MKTIVTKNNIIIYITEDLINEQDGNYFVMSEGLLIPKQEGTKIDYVEEIPDNVQPVKYCYIDGEFILNPAYKSFYSDEERIAALEDAVNSLLGF
jgi:hypothetical protein